MSRTGSEGLRTARQPMANAVFMQPHLRRLLERVVGPQRFNEPAVTRRPRVGHDNPIERSLLGAHAFQGEYEQPLEHLKLNCKRITPQKGRTMGIPAHLRRLLPLPVIMDFMSLRI